MVGNESGIANVNVAGDSGSLNGSGYASTFVGYLAAYVQPISPYPWTLLPGLEVAVDISDLFGNLPSFQSAPIAFNTYSILSNKYAEEAVATLNFSSTSGYYIGILAANLADGPTTLTTLGSTVGYLPFVSGISLMGSAIYPQVVAEPGSVAPGQSLTIIASVIGPENIDLTTSLATDQTIGATIAEGANVTATLVSPSGLRLDTVSLPESPCAQALKDCGADLTLINGYLPIPMDATPGLYTIILNAAYNDETTGFDYGGSYFGQIYVAAGASTPTISVSPSTLFEGENTTITASITYPDGTEVTHGLYTALVYPANAADEYSVLDHETYQAFNLIPLTYDATLNAWTGNATMPSPYDSALVASTNGNAEYYGGPYDVYVSGVSADGVPTNSSLTAQHGFFIQPYVYTADTVISGPLQTSQLALSNVTIDAGPSPVVFSGDDFIGNNTISGSDVTISSSTINGTLNVRDGQTTLNDVTGGDIVAEGGNVALQHSTVESLNLGSGTTASIDSASTAQTVTPALPVVTISSPLANSSYTGMVDAQVAVTGSGVQALDFILDGKPLPSVSNGAPTRQRGHLSHRHVVDARWDAYADSGGRPVRPIDVQRQRLVHHRRPALQRPLDRQQYDQLARWQPQHRRRQHRDAAERPCLREPYRRRLDLSCYPGHSPRDRRDRARCLCRQRRKGPRETMTLAPPMSLSRSPSPRPPCTDGSCNSSSTTHPCRTSETNSGASSAAGTSH